jgi:amino acid efflux transporter
VLTATRGAALYVGALLGPGLLLLPALATQVAGPASVLAWAALMLVSAPIAATFASLAVRHPVSGGVATYVEEAFGPVAGAVTGLWFVCCILIGSPAVALMGAYYVADLTGAGQTAAAVIGLVIYLAVLSANAFGLRVSSGVQLGLSALLVAVIAVAVGLALPGHVTQGWTPFVPHGWWAVGTAAGGLVWLVIGWEAMAQLAGDFRDPARDVPRAVAWGFGIVTLLYVGVAVAAVVVPAAPSSKVPLADLVGVGFGPVGRDATALLALVLTMGGMNVYVGSGAKLAAALAERGALPAWFAGGAVRSVPRRPLAVLTVTGTLMFVPLVLGVVGPADIVLATSANFVAVYLLTLAAARRMLTGPVRAAAGAAFVLFAVLAPFLRWWVLLPLGVAAVAVLTLRGRLPATAGAAG